MAKVTQQDSGSGHWSPPAEGERSWQWVPHLIPATSSSAEQPATSAEQSRPSDAAQAMDCQSWPGTDVSLPVELEDAGGDMPVGVDEGEDASMEAVRRLLGELQVAIGEVGASEVAESERMLEAPAGMAEGKAAVKGAAEAGAESGMKEPGVPTVLPLQLQPTAACGPVPELHNPVGAASTAVATRPDAHVLSPGGPTSAAPRPLETPPRLALSPAGPSPAVAASPAPKQPSPSVEAAAPAGAAEWNKAGHGAAETRAAPPLPAASVLPADVVARGAAASGAKEQGVLTTIPKQLFPAVEAAAPAGVAEGKAAVQGAAEAGAAPGVPTTLPVPLPPTAACALTASLAMHGLSPRGPPSASPWELEPSAGRGLPPASLPPAPGTQASEDPGLSVADVPRYSGGDYKSLHRQARAALNNLYAIRLQEAVAPGFDWREYVCAHPASRQLVGPGIQSFVAEPIAGTRDPNRGGDPRIDFVLQHVDGWVARLHPGRRPREDAAVYWFHPGAFAREGQTSGVGAGMYVSSVAQTSPVWRGTAQPASAGLPPVALTVEEAARVPPADRMGKATAYARMNSLRGWISPSEEHGLIDVTHCAEFAWKTWVANVRDHQAVFIGPGICSVFLTPPDRPLQLWAHRCDGTWACLQLDQKRQGQGWNHALSFLGGSR